MTERVQNNRWTILFALLCVLGFQALLPVAQHFVQSEMRVVDMEGEIVGRTPRSVDIHIHGQKLRMCAFVRMTALVTVADGSRDASLERVDGLPNDGVTKPVSALDLGVWRVYPTDNGTKAQIFVQHDCDGTVVVAKIAEVQL